jgi:pantetheine-phosphate adenylyltransferase
VRTALCPGSFDPIHLGHVEVIETAASLFDRLVVAVIRNPGKGEPLFGLEERVEMLHEVLAHLDNIEITMMKKLTVDVCRDVGADWIARGLRAVSDFDYELQMAQMNEAISNGIETIFIPCASRSSFVSSSLVREIARLGGADRLATMVPEAVAKRLKEKFD